MKKTYFLLATALMFLASCGGNGLNQEPNDPTDNTPVITDRPVDEPSVTPIDMTGYTEHSDADNTTAKETMAQAPQTTNNLFREVMVCLDGQFATASAPARVGGLDVPYTYDAASDVLTIDYGTTPVKSLAGLMCSGQIKVYNAKFVLVKNGVVTVQTTNFTIEGITFIGQMEIQSKEIANLMPTKVAIDVKNAFIKSGFNMISYKGSMVAEMLANGMKINNMKATVKCIFGSFDIVSLQSLLFKEASLPVEGEISVKMSTPVSYTYDGKNYSVDNFSIAFAENVGETTFGFEYEGKGFSASYNELCEKYPTIIEVVGVYLAVLFG